MRPYSRCSSFCVVPAVHLNFLPHVLRKFGGEERYTATVYIYIYTNIKPRMGVNKYAT